MTREEALEFIGQSVRSDVDMAKVADAIKALEQEPILDKIRAEIEQQERWLMDAGYNAYNVDIAFGSIKLVVDKCKAEGEPQESEDKCKNCKYYLNPDYTRCHECKAESER